MEHEHIAHAAIAELDLVAERAAGHQAAGHRARGTEVELATQLGVSRTPLREALLILEREGLVVSEVNKGFRVAALSEARVRELYPILGALEGLAVRESGDRLRARVGELRAVNAALRASRTKHRRHALDHQFHALLRDACPNRTIVEMVRRLWLQAQRFDGAADRGMADPVGSLRDHIAITGAIARGDLAGAARRLDDHWRHGIEVVMRWLRGGATALIVIAAVALAASTGACSAATPEPALPDVVWGSIVDEAAIASLVERWSQTHRPRTAAIEHVSVVSMAHPGVDPDQTVVVVDGTVRAIGRAGSVAVPPGATVIDGRGKYVMPGLVDMHTHTNLSDSHYVLDLANGVTSIREMDGHPFDRALDTLEQLRARGYVLREHLLGWLRFRLEAAHLPVDRPLFEGIAPLAPDED